MLRVALTGLVLVTWLFAPSDDTCRSGMCALDEADSELTEGPGAIMWCESDDDPRCAPTGSDGPSPPLVASSVAAGTSHDLPKAPSRDAVFEDERGTPTSGVRSRLERPPRS